MLRYKSSLQNILLPSLFFLGISLSFHCGGQPLNKKTNFTHQDTLRGTITPERAWWNVLYYNIYVAPNYTAKTISGFNQMSFGIVEPGSHKRMQIDLQEPMVIDSIIFEDRELKSFSR